MNYSELVKKAVSADPESWDMMKAVHDVAEWLIYNRKEDCRKYYIGCLCKAAADGGYEILEKDAVALMSELLDRDENLIARFRQTMLAYMKYMKGKSYAQPSTVFYLKVATGCIQQSDFVY